MKTSNSEENDKLVADYKSSRQRRFVRIYGKLMNIEGIEYCGLSLFAISLKPREARV